MFKKRHQELIIIYEGIPIVFKRTIPELTGIYQCLNGYGLEYDEDEAALLFKEQAENAKYSFETSVDDGIMGHAHSRTETRNGLNVEGMYSYSDGFYKRTINYVADDKGYRVIKEEVEPIGDGPVINLDGEAIVRSSLGSAYKVTIDDYQKKEKSLIKPSINPRHE